jgi:hypothetical protein
MFHTELTLMLESWVPTREIADDDSRPSISCMSGLCELEW